ncbi:LlaJI family restriction endonuclease [Fredinandcohnia onubensis]|uniref:LlaJI family restriction endonuclease n=1 Tax=Fredinandcohnia onubensis TaxID=1571209 RepID=UPI000C0BE0D0|nr:LlaJI family restriction endonuclease [Fredinandcohnia onubensis]
MSRTSLSYNFLEHNEYEIDELPIGIVNHLVDRGVCNVRQNKIKFIATGIVIYRNNFIIIFPKTYPLPSHEENLRKHAQVLFETLLKYRSDANFNDEKMDLMGGDEGHQNESLLTAYNLIKDFTQNGFLVKENRVNTLQSTGNIDWGATINKRQPIFTRRSVIYADIISKRITINQQNKLSILHRYCVSMSIEKYGWLIGISPELNIDNIGTPELTIDISYAIQFLKNELNGTFIEREINVIKLMIDFLSGIEEKSKEDDIDILVTPYFQNVWELICSELFRNQYKALKKIIPKLNWEIESNAIVQNQRPDIIFLFGQKLYILDAKYYNIDTNLPGWPDVVKQLFYAYTIFNNIKSEHFWFPNKKLEMKLKKIVGVENVFLFPSCEKEIIKYVGKVNVENNSDFDDIIAYKINTYFAMKCYVGIEDYNFIKWLIVESKKRNI